jgi:hypothetical protein
MGDVLEDLWARVFPDVDLEEADKQVVSKVVRALSSISMALNNDVFCLGRKCAP